MFYGWFKKFLAFSILFIVVEGTLSAQQSVLYQNVSVQFRKIPIDSALRILGKKVHLDLTYNSSLVPRQDTVTATFDSIPLTIVLDSLLQQPMVQYRIIHNQLILYEKHNTAKAVPVKIEHAKILTGKVVDRGDGRALPFSSVSILHQSIGVISNEDGLFMFKFPTKYQNDTLVISHLGYYLYKVPVAEAKDFKSYQMDERAVPLPEILIRSIPANELVRRAILKIPNNYFRGPYRMRSFYREIVKRDKKYLSYTEAILDIYKRPMRPTLFRDEVKVVKERKFTNPRSQDTLVFKLKGGIEAILQLDIVRNPAEFLRLNNKTYQFSLKTMQFVDGKLAYVIRFTPGEDQEEPAFVGEMFIDSKSLAILQIRFGYSKKSLRKLRNIFIVKTSRNIKSYPTNNQYVVSYQSYDGKYYIHHILGTIGLKVKQKKKWIASHYSVAFEMISTDVENKSPIRFVASETIKPNRIFSDMVSSDETRFWKNQNIILPEADITKALKRFKTEASEKEK